MLGAAIEYYDIALYGYMAPILVKVFLPHLSKLSAYFYYFLFEFFAVLCQIGGARYYGKMGDIHGRKKAMYYAMLGTSIITFCISILPTYHSIGILATSLFVLCRALQSFFLGGEYNGGAIYCLEHESDRKKYGFISGLYCALTVSGIIVASIIATVINYFGPEYFRVAYAISFVFAIFTYSIRRRITETPEYLKDHSHTPIDNTYKEINRSYNRFIAIGIASLFFGILYGLPTRIFNVILPLVTGIDVTQIMLINTFFLFLYMLLLVVFGALSDRVGSRKIMSWAALSSLCLAYPTIMLIDTTFLWAIILSKAIFATLTAAFIGPFHAWAQGIYPAQNRYKGISTAYAFGKCCATLLLALTIFTFDRYNNLWGVASILAITAFLAWRIIREKKSLQHVQRVLVG